jgi:hypothetical protein
VNVLRRKRRGKTRFCCCLLSFSFRFFGWSVLVFPRPSPLPLTPHTSHLTPSLTVTVYLLFGPLVSGGGAAEKRQAGVMSLTQEQAMSVLDFDAEAIDSAVFDELVNYLYNYPSTPQVRARVLCGCPFLLGKKTSSCPSLQHTHTHARTHFGGTCAPVFSAAALIAALMLHPCGQPFFELPLDLSSPVALIFARSSCSALTAGQASGANSEPVSGERKGVDARLPNSGAIAELQRQSKRGGPRRLL